MLPSALGSHLPDGVDPRACVELLSVRSGLGGAFGETHFLGHEDAVLLVTKASSVGDYDVYTVAAEPLPRLRKDRWRNLLSLVTDTGDSYDLELSDGERAAAARMLESLYRRREAWQPLVAMLRERIETEMGAERIAGLLAIADICLDQLDAPEDAFACYEEVHRDVSHRDAALAGMERIAGAGHMIPTIAPILENHYRRGHNPDELSWLLALEAPTLDDNQTRAAAYLEAAKLARELNELARALELYGKALVETPDDEDALRALNDLAAQAGDWTAAAHWLHAAAQAAAVAERRVLLSKRLLTVCETELGDGERTEVVARALLELDDTEVEAWRALDRTYTAAENWAALIDVINRRIPLENTSDQVALTLRLARLYEQQLADTGNAIATYYRVLDADPVHAASFDRLEALHGQLRQREALFDLLMRRVALITDDAQRAQTWIRIAGAAEALNRIPAAIDAWAHVLAHSPELPGALENLIRLHRRQRNWQAAIDAMLQLAATTQPPTLSLLSDAGAVAREQLNDAQQAFDIYRNARRVAPNDRAVLETLCELATLLEHDDELISVVQALLGIDSLSADERTGYRLDLGDALWRSDRRDEAVAAWENASDADPDNARALTNLYKGYTRLERWADLVGIIDRTIDLTDDEALVADMHLQLAELHERHLGDAVAAARCYDRVLACDPAHATARPALIRLLANQLDDPARALELARAALVTDPNDAAMRKRVDELAETTGRQIETAELYLHELDDPEAAIRLLQGAGSEDRVAADNVLRLVFRAQKDWHLLASQLRRMGDDTTRPAAERRELFRELGAVYEHELGKPDLAKHAYGRSKRSWLPVLVVTVAAALATAGVIVALMR